MACPLKNRFPTGPPSTKIVATSTPPPTSTASHDDESVVRLDTFLGARLGVSVDVTTIATREYMACDVKALEVRPPAAPVII